MATIQGKSGVWEYVIGLEVHAQITSKSKLFSSAATNFGGTPNSQVSFIDAAMPGMLPTLNEFCVQQVVKTGLGLEGSINKRSTFDRKNYFYADLPSGYQITQFYHPIISGGVINIKDEDGNLKKIRIHHIHLEQDAGKSIHDQSPVNSFIDLNRAGIALMEIVSEPEMRSPFEAAEYVKNLRNILRYLSTCDGDMEKGSLRCDVNVSMRKPGAEFGTRCEIKNINSIRNIIRAIEYEGIRQVEILESNGVINQETRLFDADSGTTRAMRSKEDAFDYRYFPDPDLLPLEISDKYIQEITGQLPELPNIKVERYIKDFKLSNYDAEVLVADKDTADYYEKAALLADPKLVANWIIGELFAYINKAGIEIKDCKITPQMISELVLLIKNDVISGKIAKEVFELMTESGESPKDLIEKHNLKQVSDVGSIQKIIEEVLIQNEDSVIAYLSGKDKLFGFFVGQVMKLSSGKASPSVVNDLLKAALEAKR